LFKFHKQKIRKPLSFSIKHGTFLCKDAYVFFFPQLWKSFSTIVENVYYNCGKAFPQLWKEKNIREFTEKQCVGCKDSYGKKKKFEKSSRIEFSAAFYYFSFSQEQKIMIIPGSYHKQLIFFLNLKSVFKNICQYVEN